MKRLTGWMMVAVVALAATAGPARAAMDMFLNLAGVQGESAKDANHKDWIDVDSFGISVTMPAGDPGGGHGGRADFSEFQFAGPVSKASPRIFEHCLTGDPFNDALLEIVGMVGPQRVVLADWYLRDVIIVHYETGASSDDAGLTDAYAATFRRIRYGYNEYDGAGDLEGRVEVEWDLMMNQVTMSTEGTVESFQFMTGTLPEPATLSLLGLGAAALAARRRRA